jgi:murein DD-endopeptidase MepM/ murein hydrolase activator NlpD
MNVILVSGKLARAKTFTLGLPQVLLLGLGLALTVLMLAVMLHYTALRFSHDIKLPYVESIVLAAQKRQFALQQEQHKKAQAYLRENLNAMAVKLGEMQAQLVRLDTVGERLAKLAGFKPQDLMFGERPGRGGAVSSLPSQDLSLSDFTEQLELLTRQVDDRSDKLGILESLFAVDSAKKKLIPTMLPVEGGWYSSNFGWRIDPFTGQRAFHEGIDVMAETGTPIYAAAGGVVIFAGRHPQYGNMIEIDHGNGLITRYAHASKLLVKVGDLVVRGVQIGKVGKTGRATGSHLHFEVRRHGAPVNPKRFLRLPG